MLLRAFLFFLFASASWALLPLIAKAHPEEAERLLDLGQRQVEKKWQEYEQMATMGPESFAIDARLKNITSGSNRG